MDREAQAKALRVRLYVLCSECARLIDLAEGNPPKREIEGGDMVRHAAEEHAAGWKCSTSGHKAEEARGRGSLRALEDAERAGKDALDDLERNIAPAFPSTPKRSTP